MYCWSDTFGEFLQGSRVAKVVDDSIALVRHRSSFVNGTQMFVDGRAE